MPPRWPVRSLTPERYGETFAVLLRHSLEYGPMREALRADLATAPVGWGLLDVGAGDGSLIADVLTADLPAPGRWLAVEPDPRRAEGLRSRLARGEQRGATADVLEEGFTPELVGRLTTSIAGGSEAPFARVLFSHSLYGLPDPAAMVEAALPLLAPGGTVVAFLQGPFGIWSLADRFEPLLQRDAPPAVDHRLDGASLARELRHRGHGVRLELLPGGFDLEGLWTPEGEHDRLELLSFALQIEFAEAPAELRSEVEAWLRAAVVGRDGRDFWNQPTAQVMVGAAGRP